MRHFSLIQYLAFSSLTTQSNSFQSSSRSKPSLNSPDASTLRLRRLHSAVQPNHPQETESASPRSSSDIHVTNRRRAMQSFLGGSLVALVAGATTSNALDMDAFVNSQLESDTKNCDPKLDRKCIPKLTKDEALCKYGQSGDARGEACKRVKANGGALPGAGSQGKSLGGAYAM